MGSCALRFLMSSLQLRRAHLLQEHTILLLLSTPRTSFALRSPLTYSVQISNTGGALYVGGTVEGDAAVDCVRCLEEARYHLCGEVEGYFLISDSGKELTEEEGR